MWNVYDRGTKWATFRSSNDAARYADENGWEVRAGRGFRTVVWRGGQETLCPHVDAGAVLKLMVRRMRGRAETV